MNAEMFTCDAAYTKEGKQPSVNQNLTVVTSSVIAIEHRLSDRVSLSRYD
jgi:hypothetical protein